MSITTVPINGTIKEPDGSPAAGAVVTFTLNAPITDGDFVVSTEPLTVTCDGTGTFTQDLYANDDTTTTPTGTYYTVKIQPSGKNWLNIGEPFNVQVPSADADGVDLFALATISNPNPPAATYVAQLQAGDGIALTPAGGTGVVTVSTEGGNDDTFIVTVADLGSSYTLDWDGRDNVMLVANATQNVTLNAFTRMVAGGSFILYITATGGTWTVTLPGGSTVVIPSGTTATVGGFTTDGTLIQSFVAKDGISASLLTTKGDVIVASASGVAARLGVGTDGQVLTSKASATNGVDWETPTGGGGGSPTYIGRDGFPGVFATDNLDGTFSSMSLVAYTMYCGRVTVPTNGAGKVVCLDTESLAANAGNIGLYLFTIDSSGNAVPLWNSGPIAYINNPGVAVTTGVISVTPTTTQLFAGVMSDAAVNWLGGNKSPNILGNLSGAFSGLIGSNILKWSFATGLSGALPALNAFATTITKANQTSVTQVPFLAGQVG